MEEKKETNTESVIYASRLPYPEIKTERENPTYAKIMLDNMAAANSEMSAVAAYFYNSLVTGVTEITTAFHQISAVEMRHLQIFGELAVQLGENPRLWTQRRNTRTYWSPSMLHYPADLKDLLHTALENEQAVIVTYQRQIEYIEDKYIQEILDRIIKDEQIHVEVFQNLLNKYCQ